MYIDYIELQLLKFMQLKIKINLFYINNNNKYTKKEFIFTKIK